MGLSFFLELGMLAAFGYWGFYGGRNTLLKWALGIGIPVLVAVLWGFLLAPKAVNRLPITGGVTLSMALFLLAAAALFFARQPALAIGFAVLAILNRMLIVFWQQW